MDMESIREAHAKLSTAEKPRQTRNEKMAKLGLALDGAQTVAEMSQFRDEWHL